MPCRAVLCCRHHMNPLLGQVIVTASILNLNIELKYPNRHSSSALPYVLHGRAVGALVHLISLIMVALYLSHYYRHLSDKLRRITRGQHWHWWSVSADNETTLKTFLTPDTTSHQDIAKDP